MLSGLVLIVRSGFTTKTLKVEFFSFSFTLFVSFCSIVLHPSLSTVPPSTLRELSTAIQRETFAIILHKPFSRRNVIHYSTVYHVVSIATMSGIVLFCKINSVSLRLRINHRNVPAKFKHQKYTSVWPSLAHHMWRFLFGGLG